MAYKIVFSDIDGTVLNSAHHVLPNTIFSVKTLLQKSIPFVLVSARMPKAIKTVTNEMNVNIPMISYSGALVLDELQNVLYDKKIASKDVMDVIKEIKLYWSDSVVINYYTGDDWFVENTDDEAVKREEKITKVKASKADFKQLLMNNILPNKFLCMTNPSICEMMEKVLKEMFPQLKIMRSSPILLEIMAKEVSKAEGIKVILEHYNLKSNEAIAFGDNYNDVDMLKFVGTGVVMQNAPEDIKAKAKYITKSNDEDGIYTYLKKISLI